MPRRGPRPIHARGLGLMAAALLGCGGDGAGARPDAATHEVDAPHESDVAEVTPDDAMADTWAPDVEVPAPPSWSVDPTAPASIPSALLLSLIAQAGLEADGLGFSASDYAHSQYEAAGALADPFRLERFRADQADPLATPALADELGAAFDAGGSHPMAHAIRRAARRLDRWLEGPPQRPSDLAAGPASARLGASIVASCAAAGRPCEGFVHPLSDALSEALLPVFEAMREAEAAAHAMAAVAPYVPLATWIEAGGFGLSNVGQLQLLRKSSVREHALGAHTRPALNLAAARLAWALEDLDPAALAALATTPVDLATPLGRIVIASREADTHPAASFEDPVWFFLDPGGDDTYRGPVGATVTPTADAVALVTVALDLAGDDAYGYDPVASPHDADGLLPADADGRSAPDELNGPLTASRAARQGAARHGIALLVDRGAGRDTYRSLAHSQGYAHLGVGVLYDEGGDDTYEAEVASQGAAAFGIGLLLDLGGHDRYRLAHSGQGMAGVAGFGLLLDAAGDDSYRADPGGDFGGVTLYHSPQMPGRANTSMAQGAATGLRWDGAELWLSGGIGVLRDASGDDTYLAGLFAQGSGYWQGTGLLSDGAGADHYDALYYVQGAGAHYALALLVDAGPGGDAFNQTLPPQYVQLGTGHDYTLGVFINAAGDDRYRFAGLAAGASNCNGVGLFIDDAGDDTYDTTSDYNSGLGNVSDECAAARPLARSVGLMLDAGGLDTYLYPASTFPVPADGGTWGHITHDLPSEHGAGRDGEGGSGLEVR